MHNKLKLMPLTDRRDIHVAQLNHKAVYEQPLNSLSHFFVKVQDHRAMTTRTTNSMNMRVPAYKCTKTRRAISFVGPYNWNRLENNLKLIKNYHSF